MATSRIRHAAAAATVVTALLFIAGCGPTTASSPERAPAAAQTPVEWAEQYCVAVLAVRPTGTPLTQVDPADRAALSDALDKQLAAFDDALSKLDQIGPSPVPAGDEGLKRTKEAMTRAKAAFTTARDKIATLPPTDSAGVEAALQTAGDEAAKAFDNLGAGLDDQELQEAAKSAPTCQSLGFA